MNCKTNTILLLTFIANIFNTLLPLSDYAILSLSLHSQLQHLQCHKHQQKSS